jgi:ligand-binding sensor domain-containing protein
MQKIIWAVVLVLSGFGQTCGITNEYYIRNLELQRGDLTGRTLYSRIFEDKEGFIWLCTNTGLIQYSGAFSHTFLPGIPQHENSVLSEYFYDILEDRQQNIWLATRHGLTRMDPVRKQINTYVSEPEDDTTIPNNRIFNIFLFNDTTLFLACDRSNIVTFDTRTLEARRLHPTYQDLPTDPGEFWVRQFYPVSDSTMIIRTNQGFYYYQPTTNVVSHIPKSLMGVNIQGNSTIDEAKEPPYQISSLYFDKSGVYWFSDPGGYIYRWELGHMPEVISDEELTQRASLGRVAFFDFDDDLLLISALGQNYTINKKTLHVSTIRFRSILKDDLSRTHVTALGRTDEGNVFIAFRNGVLGQISALQPFSYFRELSPVGEGRPLNVAYVFDDTLYQKRYISTFLDSLLFVEDLQTNSIHNIQKKSFGNNSSNRILLDSSGRLWVCQEDGILHIDRQSGNTSYYTPSVPASVLFEMEEVRPGIFIVGSFRNGLFRFEPDKGVFDKIPETNGWLSTQVYSMKYDPKQDVLWIGTVRNGLIRYDIDSGLFRQYLPKPGNPHSLGGDWVRSITIDSVGYVWMAADPGGLSRFDYNAPDHLAFNNFSLADGLPSNFIGGLVTDTQGMIWMTSLNGIASINPQNFKITPYEVEHNDHNYAFFYANMSVNQSDMLFVGTEYGYLAFHTSELKTNTIAPRIYLRGITVFGKRMQRRELTQNQASYRLRHNENHIVIDFAIINHTNPERNSIFYKLESTPTDWQQASNVYQVTFPNVAPGHYTFHIKAQNSDGVWSEEVIAIPLIIAPPFRRTIWFHLIVLAIVGSVIYAGLRYRMQESLKATKLKAEKHKLQVEMNHKIASLEMVALRSQMNPHFIFNCLNSINRFIIVNDNLMASDYLTKFSKLIRQVLDNSRSEKISLAKEIDTVNLYIEMEKLRYVDKFDYSIDIDSDIDTNSILIQPMLIQPYVENAIWHGLLHKKTGGKLQIGIAIKGNQLHICIEDNGIGRKRSEEIKARQPVRNSSHGMKVTAERMAMLNNKVNEQSEILITDLTDSSGIPCGTRVDLVLPLDKKPIPLQTEETKPSYESADS